MTGLESTAASLAEVFRKADALQVPLDQRLAFCSGEQRKLLPGLESASDDLVVQIDKRRAGAVAPAVGDKLPEFQLADSEGRQVSLGSYLERGPLVVSFNRGPWCNYCGLELQALARAYPFITAAGGDVVSIVPELQSQARALQAKHELPFGVLIDRDLLYAVSLGLVFWVGAKIKDVFGELGVDLSQFQGNDGWFLPIPATLVVGRDGRVLARFVDPDFRNRMNTEDVLAAVSDAGRSSR